MTRCIVAAWCLSVVMVLPGCSGPAEPPKAGTASVAGTVQLDGKPMSEEKSDISFGVLGQAPSIIPIKNGKFEGTAPVGEVRVEIRAYKKGAQPMMDGKPFGDPPNENYIPEKFNTQSTLKATIPAAGVKDLKFDVESK